jgi:phenylalanyl-tRNA synthetase beta chain
MRRLREQLARAGFLEARTLPLGPAESAAAVALKNPLSASEGHLRMHLLPGLVRRVEHNWSVRERDIRLFEVGTVFRSGAPPEEQLALAGVLTGARRPPHWADGGDVKQPDMDIWDLKHHFELAVSEAAPGARVVPGSGEDLWRAVAGVDARLVGRAARLPADAPKWAGAVFGFEVEVDVAAKREAHFAPLPTQPPTVQDLSLVLPGGVTAEQVEALLRRAGGALLERLIVLDEYRGPNVPAGTRGVTWRCVFRDPSRTLRDSEVDDVIRRSVALLEGELGVRRRAG